MKVWIILFFILIGKKENEIVCSYYSYYLLPTHLYYKMPNGPGEKELLEHAPSARTVLAQCEIGQLRLV